MGSLKILEACKVSPPSATELSLPLTFFDLLWLKFQPVERLFFYSLPQSDSDPDPSFFFETLIPKLKHSLYLTLQHFLPLAGNVVWPSNSQKPIIKYTPGDGVSLIIAESDANFDHLSENSPIEAIKFRPLVPDLDSFDSHASVISLQITLFPNRGICIGISTHHAVLDGKSSTLFMKAWAYLCKIGEDSPPLLPELEPFLDRNVIKDRKGLGIVYINEWIKLAAKSEPAHLNNRSLKILSAFRNLGHSFQDISLRATFELSRADLEKIKRWVLSMWDKVDGEESIRSKPPTLSTFVLTCAYVSACIAKAIEIAQNEKRKVVFPFMVDCRARLEPPVHENYSGNCVLPLTVNTQRGDFTKEDGVVIAAKKIYNVIKMQEKEKGVFDEAGLFFSKFLSFAAEGSLVIGVAGSTRFGVYGTDFGWGRPVKVDIASIDRNIVIGMAESKDGNGGVEVGLVLNKHVMDHFVSSFRAGIESF